MRVLFRRGGEVDPSGQIARLGHRPRTGAFHPSPCPTRLLRILAWCVTSSFNKPFSLPPMTNKLGPRSGPGAGGSTPSYFSSFFSDWPSQFLSTFHLLTYSGRSTSLLHPNAPPSPAAAPPECLLPHREALFPCARTHTHTHTFRAM